MNEHYPLLIAALIIIWFVWAFKRDKKLKAKYESDAIARLTEFMSIKKLADESVVFYRLSGNLWIETSEEDTYELLKNTCKTPVRYGYIYHEGVFCMSYDPNKNGVLIVEGKLEYDFSKGMYYSDWAEGNKAFNDKINRAMGQS